MLNKEKLIHNPLVSARVITYNHEKFIRECLEGIFMQETNFPFEVVIGEDCSTDDTRLICEEFKAKYPERVNLLAYNKNIGAQENARRAREACRGKYIAFCEGDDYWTDPLKLQKQADFLEGNSAYAMCFHNCFVKLEHEPNKEFELFHEYSKDSYGITDLFGKWLVPTASVMFRNNLISDYPDWLSTAIVGDTPFFILLASFGKIKLLPGIMGVYRRHSGGATNLLHGYNYWEKMIELYSNIDRHFDFRYKKEIYPVLEWFHYKLTQVAVENRDYEKYRHYAKRCFSLNKKLIFQYTYFGMYIVSITPINFRIYANLKGQKA